MLLHGPPGTGKTLIAQTVCALLNVTPKIVRGPEIFSCMLGDSEKRIRDLFDDAREDQLNFGASSKLHVIVFDEIDAICKRRGNRNEIRETVHDNVTTQFLAEIDGMIQLDNILLIGTTNNLDIIDPAILRPGRIEMLIKIEPPDANARFCIFDIHTRALLRNGALSSDVDVSNIIRYTNGLTGAHIERVVRLAVQVAMRRDVIHRGRFDISLQEAENLEVSNDDFIKALEKLNMHQDNTPLFHENQ